MSDRDQLYPYANGQHYHGKSAREVFQDIYEQNTWNISTQESVSGEGSTTEQTQALKKDLPRLLRQFNVHSMLDLPCGDFHWMQELKLEGIHYTGADIVSELVQKNQRLYGCNHREFTLMDLINDPLPQVDLIFCRDCLVHFSHQDVSSALTNIKASGSTYLMMTHFPLEDHNKDIITGGWRPANFCLPPFNLPLPLELLNEQCSEMEGAFHDKSMAVWKIEDI
ncbi:class I SAM-dependent methyltransferase [Catalinimonas alkaloidigena]|uniref:class I SAM-dependent methyltransferase n=1 Tax=Catalinimonas alkaloidigena TaxID=1075417 RepID=UPI0024055117|nr:class I SAM-dependent methyltransferase [Catalinimonas alkaloidigena]